MDQIYKATVFVVEDDAIQMLMLKKLLQNLDYSIVGSAGNGQEAIFLIEEKKPDIVLLDINLPGPLTGIDVAARVNEVMKIPHIYLTAYSDEETFRRAIPTNPAGFILKPYNSVNLDYQIQIALKKAVLEREIQENNAHLTIRNAIASEINSILDLDTIFDLTVRVVSENLAADGGMVHLFDEGRNKLLLRRETGVARRIRNAVMELSLQDWIIGHSAALGCTIIVEDLSREKGKLPASAVEAGWRSLICTPLKREDKLLGTLTLFSSDAGKFSGKTSKLLDTVGQQIAIAIENASLYQKMHVLNEDLEHRVTERTKNLEILYTLSQDMNYIMDFRQLFSLLFSHLHALAGFDLAVGLIFGEDQMEVYSVKTCPIEPSVSQILKEQFINAVWNISGDIKIIETDNYIDLGLSDYNPDRTIRGIASVYETPLYFEKKLIAFLALGAERENAFDAGVTRLIEIVLNQASTMIRRLKDLMSSERRRLEELIRSLPEGIVLLDRNKKVIIRNPEAERMLNILFLNMVPEVITRIGDFSLEDTPSSNGKPIQHTLEGSDKEGHVFELTTVCIEEGFDSGGLILVIKDITTERKVSAQIKLQERLAAVGRLAAGIAHDFNNILTGIMGYSEYLQLRKDVPEAAMTYLKKIIEQSKRAGSLIQQILDFSRTSVAERLPIDMVPFSKEMVKLFKRLIPENIHISLETSEKACMIKGNPTQIQQILTNLVVNSRDAMPAGGGIKILLGKASIDGDSPPPIPDMTPGTWIILKVTDTGSGIPEDILGRIMEPFFTTKEVGKGSGLGLSQVYGLVQQHEGFIDIRSEVNKGTSITLYFPETTPKETEAEEITELKIPEKSEGIILLVEDEADVLEILRNVLLEIGFTIHTASNGSEALDIYRKFADKIELVVTDVIMPKMGGRELFREIKKINPEAKVVFMTGHPLEEISKLDEFRGALAVLHKPLEFATLIQTISSILNPGYGVFKKSEEGGFHG